MTLSELNVGKNGRVLEVGGEKVLRHRLLEMGITPGTKIAKATTAPTEIIAIAASPLIFAFCSA